jgi:hypothetical protein
MQIHNLLYRGWAIVMLVTLLLPTASRPGTAALTGAFVWAEVGASSAIGGGISDNSAGSYNPSLAVAPDGRPYVAWDDGSWDKENEIYVRRWNGSSWEEVGSGSASGGGISDNDADSYRPSLAVAPDGRPYVAWHDESGGDDEIYVKRWNGSNWAEVGSGSASGGGISDNDADSYRPSLAVAPDGRPYVAWCDEGGGDPEIYVRRWNGSNWAEVGSGSASGGGISNNSGWSEFPSVAVAPDGTPYVAWHDSSGGDYEIYVRRWNGSNWEEVGSGSASGGGISDNSGRSEFPSVAVAPDGRPYVAWYDNSGGDYEIYVRRWNGSNWEEVGSGSASGGGISNSDRSESPSLAVALDGRPYVAWQDGYIVCVAALYCQAVQYIYVRRWNGSNWEEVGNGSASGEGISNSGWSGTPSLAVAPDGTPYVAWAETDMWGSHDIGGDDEIYVRRWVYRELSYLPLVLNKPCDPYDPNENRRTAWGPLESGQSIHAQICPWDSRDVYWFDAWFPPGGVQVTIDLTNMPGNVDFDLYLWDETGFDPVARSEKPAGQDERIIYTLPDWGVYYVDVYPRAGAGSYTLQWSWWE